MKPMLCGLALTLLVAPLHAQEKVGLVRTARSGAWSAAATWEGGKIPSAGVKVQVRPGHDVVYDVNATDTIRSLHIGGTLRFATDRDTRLDVGLVRIQAGDSVDEEGFDCSAHVKMDDVKGPRPALLVGTAEKPI